MPEDLVDIWSDLVSKWTKPKLENFSLFRSIVGRVHINASKLKEWEARNKYRGFYQYDDKKAKEAMLKVLKEKDVPLISLVVMSPNLRDASANDIKPAHTWLCIVIGENSAERES
jgi:hypothetical protein